MRNARALIAEKAIRMHASFTPTFLILPALLLSVGCAVPDAVDMERSLGVWPGTYIGFIDIVSGSSVHSEGVTVTLDSDGRLFINDAEYFPGTEVPFGPGVTRSVQSVDWVTDGVLVHGTEAGEIDLDGDTMEVEGQTDIIIRWLDANTIEYRQAGFLSGGTTTISSEGIGTLRG